MSLRKDIIRLAHTHPEFRKDLLPLLKDATFDPNEIGEKVPGPLVDGEINKDLGGEFTQQENAELSQAQEGGKLASGKTAGSKMMRRMLGVRVLANRNGDMVRGRMVLAIQSRAGLESEVLVRFTATMSGNHVVAFSPIPSAMGAGADILSGIYKAILEEAIADGLFTTSEPVVEEGMEMMASDDRLRKEIIRLAHEHPEFRKDLLPVLKEAGCEKLPEGPMRDNCMKKKEEGAKNDKDK